LIILRAKRIIAKSKMEKRNYFSIQALGDIVVS